MDEYIKRSDAVQCARDVANDFKNEGFVEEAGAADTVGDWLQGLSAADVRPVVSATWYDDGLYGMIEGRFCSCSVCKAQNVGESNYCPNCGAYMREVITDGN